MVCKIMVMMTLIDHDGDVGVDEEIAVIDDEYENMYCWLLLIYAWAQNCLGVEWSSGKGEYYALKQLAKLHLLWNCRYVDWWIRERFFWLLDFNVTCTTCPGEWFRGSGWVSVGLVWAGREYAWEAPQMGLHHAWLALKDPAFLPTTSALSPSPPSCLSGESGIYTSIQPQHIIHDCRLCVVLWQNKTSNVTLTKKKCRLLTLTKPLLSEMLLVSFNLWNETTWKYFHFHYFLISFFNLWKETT